MAVVSFFSSSKLVARKQISGFLKMSKDSFEKRRKKVTERKREVVKEEALKPGQSYTEVKELHNTSYTFLSSTYDSHAVSVPSYIYSFQP